MTITETRENGLLNIALEGRLDSNTAPQLQEYTEDLTGITDMVFDMENLEYISSAGLRVILKAQKTMQQQGHLKVVNVNEVIMDILELTGFTDILEIKKKKEEA